MLTLFIPPVGWQILASTVTLGSLILISLIVMIYLFWKKIAFEGYKFRKWEERIEKAEKLMEQIEEEDKLQGKTDEERMDSLIRVISEILGGQIEVEQEE